MRGFQAVRLAGAVSPSVDVDDRSTVRTHIAENWSRIRKRFIVLLMSCTGTFISMWMSMNLGTLVLRIYQKGDTHSHAHILNFTESERDVMYMSENFGMMTGMIPGALAVIHFSAYKTMAASALLSSILHLALPLTTHHSSFAIIIIDFLRGLVVAPLLPACVDMWRVWAPTRERTTLVAITFSGWYFAASVCFSFNMYLNDFLGEMAGFFSAGCIGIIWSLLWLLVVHESPSSHPHITQAELQYLEQSISPESRIQVSVTSIPIKSILSSSPTIAVCLCFSVSFFTRLIISIMSVMDSLEFHSQNWLLEHLQTHLFWLSVILCGVLSDFLISRNRVSTTLTRKITNSGGLLVCGIALACTVAPDRNFKVAAVLLASIAQGFSISGLTANTLDISPKYACVMIALGEMVAFVFIITFSGNFKYVVNNDHEQRVYIWHAVSLVSSSLCIAASVFYALKGSGQEQPWSGGAQRDARSATGSQCFKDTDMRDDLELTQEERL